MIPRIVEESPEALEQYATVPIRFLVRARHVVASPEAGSGTEEPVNPPYEYDYDLLDHPKCWRQWDLGTWGFLAAFDGATRVGGAAIAFRTPDLGLLEGRPDLACLWDIRVRPEHRGHGIGTLLFQAAKSWALNRGAREMKIETQDINVPACRFYMRQGCRLTAANPGVYERHPHQVQLFWTTPLA
ncbi:MAG: GNAT family N-acetyltransferase [Planctomycetota bacterium]